MRTPVPVILKHVKVCGNEHTYCAHPLFGEMMNFGNGEIAFMHQHTDDFTYTDDANLRHGQGGVHAKAKIMLTRSLDGGYTWPESEKVIVYDGGMTLEEKRAMFTHKPSEGDVVSQAVLDGIEEAPEPGPDTVFHFGQSYCGKEIKNGGHALRSYVSRSDDRGRTWSPVIVEPLHYDFTFLQGHDTLIRRPGKLIKAFVASRKEDVDDCSSAPAYRAVAYCSEDNGVTWEYMSDIAKDLTGECSYSYVHLIDLGGNRLAATVGAWREVTSRTRWISICYSDDLGLNWTEPRRIQAFGVSPYPLRLQDGRLLVVYARRFVPAARRGIYGIISEDEGKTWSDEFVLRAGDATSPDIGYPEATQMEDGSIFVGYYYCVDDGLPRGGARHIAGTIFRLD